MTNDASQTREPLTFPFQDVPEFGDPVEIAEGIIWVRFPLPFALDHVNVYFIRDGEGWAVIDTGINTKPAIATWQAVLRDVLRGEPITRVIATHVHPDHIGLAGWLCERFDAPLLTSLSSYSESRLISLAPNETGSRQFFDFYVSHGMTAEGAGIVAIRGNEYLQLVYPLPRSYHRLVRADVLNIGHREFRVVTGSTVKCGAIAVGGH